MTSLRSVRILNPKKGAMFGILQAEFLENKISQKELLKNPAISHYLYQT